MTLRSAVAYWCECDACGNTLSERGVRPYATEAWDLAWENGWTEVGGRHFCEGCSAEPGEPDDRAGGLPPTHGDTP